MGPVTRTMNEMTKYERLRHEFAPVFDENSRILILGSFPSVKSRESRFFTGIRRTGSGRYWRLSPAILCRRRWRKRRLFC